MSTAYREEDALPYKVSKEAECLAMVFTRISESMNMPYIENKISDEFLEELRLNRCLWERILRTLDEQLFVDYQMEKFGEAYKSE